MTDRTTRRQSIALIALIFFQGISAVFFLGDTISDMLYLGAAAINDLHLQLELMATGGLIVGIAIEIRYLMFLLRRQARFERGMEVASGALNDLIEGYFANWALTAAEQDVAMFAIKGFSIAEIARFRGSQEGTVKTHLNAIYRKAGVAGRGPLVSLLIEDLMSAPLVAKPVPEKAG